MAHRRCPFGTLAIVEIASMISRFPTGTLYVVVVPGVKLVLLLTSSFSLKPQATVMVIGVIGDSPFSMLLLEREHPHRPGRNTRLYSPMNHDDPLVAEQVVRLVDRGARHGHAPHDVLRGRVHDEEHARAAGVVLVDGGE